MVIELSLLDSGSPDDTVDAKYRVIDVLETREKLLKSSTLKLFNKKTRNLIAGILTTDDSENTEDLPAYDGALTGDEEGVGLVFPSDILEMSDEDDEIGKDDDNDDSDDDSSIMSDSDTLLED